MKQVSENCLCYLLRGTAVSHMFPQIPCRPDLQMGEGVTRMERVRYKMDQGMSVASEKSNMQYPKPN